ncbi:FKBP-type peptidyl-prolyl cis-trans isomerase [Candidatus Gracilibacteria bacterium]|nr:FKBP-type peptidyl-prolyl cis-trans isomerase [Candidatus Gracilibacteria bacterium]
MKKLLPLFVCTFLLFGCEKEEESQIASEDVIVEKDESVELVFEEAETNIDSNNEKMTTEKQVTELKIEILKEGTGEEAKKEDNLKMHYTGTLMDGTKFDSSVDRGTPFNFTLGVGQVIAGWDEGIVGMKVGEKRKLTIPYSMAYGEMGYPPVIPAKAILIFDIELIEIVK